MSIGSNAFVIAINVHFYALTSKNSHFYAEKLKFERYSPVIGIFDLAEVVQERDRERISRRPRRCCLVSDDMCSSADGTAAGVKSDR
jgi:hypothetical protein